MKSFFTTLLLLAIYLSSPAQTVTIGAGALNGTASNGATGDPGPMYRSSNTSNFVYSMHHYLYTQSELAAAGIPANTLITKLAWAKDNNAASNANFLFQIWMKNSILTNVQTAPQTLTALTTGSTQVYNNSSTSLPATIGFIEYTLSTPILYTGGALEITVNFNMSSGTSPWTTAGISWKKDNISNRTLSYCNSTLGTSLNNARTVRPQIQITYMPSICSGTPNTTTLNGNTGACSGSNFTLRALGRSKGTGISYKWQRRIAGTGSFTDVTGFTDTFITTAHTTTVTQTWEYRFVTTCSGSGLSSNSNVYTVTIAPPPVVTGITHTNAGPTYTFTGTGVQHADTYYWEYGDGSSGSSGINTYGTGGIYNVKLVVGNICSTDTVEVPVSINIACNTIEAGTLTAASDVICEAEMTVLQPTGYLQGFDVAYQWQNRQLGSMAAFTDIPGETLATLSFAGSEDMEYRMKATCTSNAATDVTNAIPITVKKKPAVTTPAEVTARQFEDAVFTVSAIGRVNYRWQSSLNNSDFIFISDNGIYNGVNTAQLTVKNVAYSQSGQLFRCVVEDTTTCGFNNDTSGGAQLVVLNTQSVEDRSNKANITIYPNPATKELLIKAVAYTGHILAAEITDITGKTIRKENIRIDDDTKINVSSLPTGQYILRFNDQSGNPAGTTRFIKQ